MENIKRIPYGVSNFRQVVDENLYYADKTMYLEKMENTGNFLFLARPRRFGKSIFISMMREYYDINERENFDRYFAGLYIHSHPTRDRAAFQVLFLDLSQVGGDSRSARRLFEDYGCEQLNDFAKRYARFYDADFEATVFGLDTFAKKLNYIHNSAFNANHRLYLIIDEYDNFTNNILNHEGEHVYHALTHASGFYRDVFKLFKPSFARILMMGVQPITLDDLTSGYNIATNISLDSDFATMLGFSESEVRTMIQYYQKAGLVHADEDDVVGDMKPWYDNYCFAKESLLEGEPKMFNSDMVCFYLSYFVRHGHAPEQRLDPNTKTDYKKLKNIVRIETLDNRRLNIIHTIAEQGEIVGTLNSSFPAERIADEDNFISLLYYYGMLTITGVKGARLRLGIPNNNVRLQYYEFLREEYSKHGGINISTLQEAFDAAAYDGNWRPMVETITDAYHGNSSVRSLMEGERNLQGFMSAYFSLCPYYLVAPEVEMNHGYCDFFFFPDHARYPEVAHSYILELKYLKADASADDASRQWREAVAQVRQYAKDRKVGRLLCSTKLHLLVVQIRGSERLREEEIES